MILLRFHTISQNLGLSVKLSSDGQVQYSNLRHNKISSAGQVHGDSNFITPILFLGNWDLLHKQFMSL